MCGRFLASRSPDEVRRWFRTVNPTPNFNPRYNVAPTDTMPVVRFNPKTKERSLDLLRWGLIPSWANNEKIGYQTINARTESIETKPAFREAFNKRRCLVPADGFYEWRKLDSKTKQPYCIRLKGAGMFAFAGLWENWKQPSGEWLRTFTIVTTNANELCAPIHERMPVILDPADYAKWLGENEAAHEELLGLLRPFPAAQMEACAIGLAVGNVRNDSASLIEPIDA